MLAQLTLHIIHGNTNAIVPAKYFRFEIKRIAGMVYYNVAMGSTIWHDMQCYAQCKMSLKVFGRNNSENAMKCKTLCLFH